MKNNNLYEISFSNSKVGVNPVFCSVFKILKILFYALSVYLFFVAFNFNSYMWILFVLTMFLGYISSLLQGRFNLSCDYLYVEGTLIFTNVYKNTKRYKIAEIECKNILGLYLVNTPNYNKKAQEKGVSIKKVLAHLNEGVKIAINYVSGKGKNTLLLIKYDETFLSYILKRVNGKIIDKQLVEYLKDKND